MAGAECCVPAPPSEHCGAGIEEKWGALNVYFNSPPSTSPSKAVLLVSDIFGWEAPLLRKLADKISLAGYAVVVPDYFKGDPYLETYDLFNQWLPKHFPLPEPVEESKEIIETLKNKGFKSIGVAGFCWGAKVVVTIVKEGIVQAAILLHPSLVTVEDIKEVKVPIAILGAEIDEISPPSLIKEFETTLVARHEVPHLVKIFPGVNHGWTIRYDLNDKNAVAFAEESHSDMLTWFGKYL